MDSQGLVAAVGGGAGAAAFLAQARIWWMARQAGRTTQARRDAGVEIRRIESDDDRAERLWGDFGEQLRECRSRVGALEADKDRLSKQANLLEARVFRLMTRDEAMRGTILSAGMKLPAMPALETDSMPIGDHGG